MLDLLYVPAALAYLPVLLYQMVALKKNRRGWRQRLGGVPRRAGDRACVWIHAVSLGEVNATQRLVSEIGDRRPDADVVISATTDTGYAAARRLYPDRLVFRYPLDFSFCVNRALDRLRPSAVVLMELEVWPNFLALTARRGVPVGVANGRVTEDKSMRRFGRPFVRGLARTMFSRIAWIAAQDDVYAERFRRLGARPEAVSVTGTMKYDTAVIGDHIPGDAALAAAMGLSRRSPLVVGGSTGPGEEALLLDAYAELLPQVQGLQLALIPRKPERFGEVAALIEARGYACRRRSRRPDKQPEPREEPIGSEPIPVFLGDTMGELRKFYALADAVFVGRSLSPMGGSDLMEVAALGRPMCFGPHTENFAEVARKLLDSRAALRLDGPEDLVSALRRMLEDQTWAAEMGRRAQAIVQANTGATRRTVDLLCRALDGVDPARGSSEAASGRADVSAARG